MLETSLREIRVSRGLSQEEVARRASVSATSVRAYESGARHPRRETLRSLIVAMGIPGDEAAELLFSAGYAAQPDETAYFRYGSRTLAEIRTEVEGRPWPAYVTNQATEMVATNAVFERLAAIDLNSEYQGVTERSLIEAIANERFASRLVNWDEVVGFMIGLIKADPRGTPGGENPLPWLAGPIERLAARRPELIRRFVGLYDGVQPVPHRLRNYFPLRWRIEDETVLDFACTISLCDLTTELHLTEWIPASAACWMALAALSKSG